MRSEFAASDLTPEQRRAEIVAIFAAGILRRRKLAMLRDGRDEFNSKSSREGLEISRNTALSVHTG